MYKYLQLISPIFAKLRFGLFIMFIFFSTAQSTLVAQGDLLIFPKRLNFEEKNRTQQINLANTGKDTAVYNMSFVEFRMTETGAFEEISEPDLGQQFAAPFLRVYPRVVTLAPNESQTVKVQLVNLGKLEEGEYRSHLYFRAVKNSKPLGQDEAKETNPGLSVKIEAVFGVSIANIIRKGISNTSITISDLKYEEEITSNNYDLSFDINRVGNMSIYGDIAITYTSKEDKLYEVAKVKGIAVYTPGTLRKMKILLQKPKDINFKGGRFNVIYTENESKEVIAQKELNL